MYNAKMNIGCIADNTVIAIYGTGSEVESVWHALKTGGAIEQTKLSDNKQYKFNEESHYFIELDDDGFLYACRLYEYNNKVIFDYSYDEKYCLIYLKNNRCTPFVVAYKWHDPRNRHGRNDGTWEQGHYFTNYEDAVNYFNKVAFNVEENAIF